MSGARRSREVESEKAKLNELLAAPPLAQKASLDIAEWARMDWLTWSRAASHHYALALPVPIDY